jgi:hypothetical protein
MSSAPDKPGRLPFLDNEPWPPETRDIRKMTPLGGTPSFLDHDIEPVEVSINLKKLAEDLNQDRIKTIALEMVSLTFGEMVEYAESVIEAKGDNCLPDPLILATILHTAAKNLLNGSNHVARSADIVPVTNGKPKNNRNKSSKDDPGSTDIIPATGK